MNYKDIVSRVAKNANKVQEDFQFYSLPALRLQLGNRIFKVTT
jgi:hypothetical protein